MTPADRAADARSKPVRLRLSRSQGFRLQDASRAINGLPAVRVSRPGLWGNYAAKRAGILDPDAARLAFRAWVETEASSAWKARARIDLGGCNLACWCEPGQPCHADVLLELANRPTCTVVVTPGDRS